MRRNIRRDPAGLPVLLTEGQRVDAQALAMYEQPSARAKQTALFFQEYDAREVLLSEVSNVVRENGAGDVDAIVEAVHRDLTDSTIVREGVTAAFDNDSRVGHRVVRDAIKEETGDAIALAFRDLVACELGEQLRENQAEGLRRSFKEDPDVRAAIAEIVRTEVRAEIRAALQDYAPAAPAAIDEEL